MVQYMIEGFKDEMIKMAHVVKVGGATEKFWKALDHAWPFALMGLIAGGTSAAGNVAINTIKAQAQKTDLKNSYDTIKKDSTIKQLIKENPRLASADNTLFHSLYSLISYCAPAKKHMVFSGAS